MLPTDLRVFIALALMAGAAAPGRSQFVQYTPTGALAETTETTAESAKQSAANARWNLGKVALDPRFELRDISYYDNVFASADETTSIDDVRGSVGAGLSAYLNLGSKSFLTGYVAPEYSWWHDQSELSELAVNWGAGWFGHFNHLTATANVSLSEREQPLSDEIDAPVRIEQERSELRVELGLTDAVGLIASATTTEVRNGDDLNPMVPGLSASSLDRDTDSLLVGATLAVRDWTFGLGIESSEVDLLVDPEGRSNTSDSPFAEIKYRAGRVDLELSAIDRELDFVNPDLEVGAFTAGSGRLAFELSPAAQLSVYGARSTGFAAIDTDSVVIQDRQGASLSSRLGSRFELTVLSEIGDSEFRDPIGKNRSDDLQAWGATLLWKVRENLHIRFHARDSTWDSSLDEFDRSQRSFGIDLEFGSGLFPW